MNTALIALDWGITSLRAYRLDKHGEVKEDKSEASGILQIPEGAFEQTLDRFLGSWFHQGQDTPVIASGMITSKQGWIETDYLECPASLPQLAECLVPHTTRSGWKIHFVPGISFEGPDGVPDVMRGEETQIFGALDSGDRRRLMILPGTHSKWIETGDETLERFATFMTGEIYAAVKDHTILGKLAEKGRTDTKAFLQGAEYGLTIMENTGGLLHKLFSARSLALFDRLAGGSVESYLSGLLIGAEIAEGLKWVGHFADFDSVTLVGDTTLTELYEKALGCAEIRTRQANAECAAVGLYRIARTAGLIEGGHEQI
jgi:2-dehydro-3-deoxygalactonokinase